MIRNGTLTPERPIDEREWQHQTIEHAREAFVHLDPEGRVRFANPAAASLLGYAAVEHLTAARALLSDLLPTLEEDEVLATIEALRGGERVVARPRPLRPRDGELRWVESSARAAFDGERFLGADVTLLDVTDQHRTRAILEAVRIVAERLLRSRWRDELATVLGLLAEACGVDRAFVIGVSEGDTPMTVVERWEAPGEPENDGRWAAICGRHQWRPAPPGAASASPADIPCEDCPIRAEIEACVVVPIENADRWGMIGFQSRDDRTWTTTELDAMRTAAGTIAAAIDRELAEDRYRRLTERIPGVAYEVVMADGGDERYVSPRIEDLLGYPAASWGEGSWEAAVHPDDRDRALAENRRIRASIGRYAQDYRMIRSDGAAVWVHDEGEHVTTKGRPGQLRGLLTDVTARREAEGELEVMVTLLRQTDKQRRTLIEQLTQAQEVERARIAADLHDDAVQAMTVVGLRVDLALGTCAEDATKEQLGLISQSVSGAIARLRRMLFELRPPALDDGLVPALESYLAAQDGPSMLRWEIRGRFDDEPGARTRQVLYRIAQEALTNARRHAAASSVLVDLEVNPDGFLVRITDDGRGFDPQTRAEANGHIGLASMLERAESVGGWLRVDSAPGRGTTVEFLVPRLDETAATRIPA